EDWQEIVEMISHDLISNLHNNDWMKDPRELPTEVLSAFQRIVLMPLRTFINFYKEWEEIIELLSLDISDIEESTIYKIKNKILSSTKIDIDIGKIKSIDSLWVKFEKYTKGRSPEDIQGIGYWYEDKERIKSILKVQYKGTMSDLQIRKYNDGVIIE
ncbi:MAG: hypothetical protein ACOCRO_04965, partial [Halanaerobiales bacterium]